MFKKDKFQFLSNYTIASYLMLATVVIGAAILSIRGKEDLPDLLLGTFILALRYVSFILIKRRFHWSKYLMVILLFRNIYRIWHAFDQLAPNYFYISLICIQAILTFIACYLVFRPQTIIKRY